MVIPALPPFSAGKMLIVCASPRIFILQPEFRRFFTFSVQPYNTFRTEFGICMNKNMQAVRILPQDIIRAASYNDTASFLRQFQNCLTLHDPKIVGGIQPVHGILSSGRCKHIGKSGFSRRIFPLFFYILRCKTCFFRHLFDQFFVIVWNLQPLCRLLSYTSSSAAEFPADSNYFVHQKNLLLF